MEEMKKHCITMPDGVQQLYFSGGQERIGSIGGSKGLSYQLGSRTYTDVQSLQEELQQEQGKYVKLYRDCYGSKVLSLWTSLPTFDSGDRQWDSLQREYLVCDGENVHLVDCHSGYCLGSITLYRCLAAATAGLKHWLEELGFPTQQIQWLEPHT